MSPWPTACLRLFPSSSARRSGIHGNAGLVLVLGDSGGDREDVVIADHSAPQIKVGVASVPTDTIFPPGSEVCRSATPFA